MTAGIMCTITRVRSTVRRTVEVMARRAVCRMARGRAIRHRGRVRFYAILVIMCIMAHVRWTVRRTVGGMVIHVEPKSVVWVVVWILISVKEDAGCATTKLIAGATIGCQVPYVLSAKLFQFFHYDFIRNLKVKTNMKRFFTFLLFYLFTFLPFYLSPRLSTLLPSSSLAASH